MRLIDGVDRRTWARPSEAKPPPTGTDSPRAATPGPERAGFLARMWGRYSSELRRVVLGRSGWDYLKQYTGDDAYWDNVVAAQRECRTPAAHAPVGRRTQQSPTLEPPR
jgi:hypothetical protein